MPNTAPDSTQETAVAVGVVYNARGEVLITRRHAHQHQGDLWELPGGKIEPGEDVLQALRRELLEELGLVVEQARPLIEIPWRYADKAVRLQTFRVNAWRAEAGHDFSGPSGLGCEGQPWRWQTPYFLDPTEFPAANRSLLRAAQLPSRFLITGQSQDFDQWMQRLHAAYAQGIRWVQVRWPQEWAEFSQSAMDEHFAQIRAAYPQAAKDPLRICWNGDLNAAESLPIDGVHLNRHQLAQLSKRPNFSWVSASCHNPEELKQAAQLDVDFVWLSPVLPTKSHPEASGIGWETFAAWMRDTQVPVYALGGVSDAELERAQSAGAQGVAAISAWWKVD
jgi:8-oxo-dGTP diphosphatase